MRRAKAELDRRLQNDDASRLTKFEVTMTFTPAVIAQPKVPARAT